MSEIKLEHVLNEQTSNRYDELAALIWKIANILHGLYKPHEYGKVILPMTVIKRLHDTLLPNHNQILKELKELPENLVSEFKNSQLEKISGYRFYNKSSYTFDTLLKDPKNIEDNFRSYLNGFSDNVQEILDKFEFRQQIEKLTNNNKLFSIINEFNRKEYYLGADEITSSDMGYVFEELIRKFSESHNEQAGSHFTSRDIVYLMTDLLLVNQKDETNSLIKTVYDQTMGTSQMLSAMAERIKLLDANISVETFGQEINGETYAIAKADTMIRGGNPDFMRLGSTLSNDAFKNRTFDYVISNPPFGISWESEKTEIKNEHDSGENGRFAPGLPKISDSQLLFLLNGIKKLNDNGRMAIIHNASALFSGDADSGESNIRKYVIENDWLETIIQLPENLFFNTSIPTYIWILTKNKLEKRKGKVQLIDASLAFSNRKKNIGTKRVDIEKIHRELIVQVYGDFTEKIYHQNQIIVESKIFNNEDFGYLKVTVENPLKDENGKIIFKKDNKSPQSDAKLRDYEEFSLPSNNEEEFPYINYVNSWIKNNVIPFNSEAWVDHKKTKIGYKIPFLRLFYKYQELEEPSVIFKRILDVQDQLQKSITTLLDFNNDNN
ncbi:Type I restriction-modification system, DNA-methyltransferase subunit M [[Mycoplasma] cavipharyngis]|uniref:type I restriction-modification system subunit M n=1 Tax=[Mycoplasma] cavipharyngis TaxID=92757 RepID=UPI003704181D